jgi:hypothetical protein
MNGKNAEKTGMRTIKKFLINRQDAMARRKAAILGMMRANNLHYLF